MASDIKLLTEKYAERIMDAIDSDLSQRLVAKRIQSERLSPADIKCLYDSLIKESDNAAYLSALDRIMAILRKS